MSRALAFLVGTGAGLGYAPFASGTFGSLLALPLALICWSLGGHLGVALGCAIAIPLCWWAAGGVERALGRKDPGEIVSDEIAGQWVALLALPPSPRWWLAAFLAFRLFDVWKPGPIGRLEKRGGAFGIMIDDLLAGVAACLLVHALRLASGWL